MARFFNSLEATKKATAFLLSSSSLHHAIPRIPRNGFICSLCQGHRPTAGIVHQRRTATPTVAFRSRRYTTTSKKISDPLHILFCGSDDFSCASLKALHDEHVQNPELIRSIDVVVRPGKRTGRGYKTIRHPPLRSLATSLGLQIHERDTFTGWDMPPKTNLIIAVSFGLFVPPRLLRRAQYGGLNLHPSLLPDLRGPAPLQHTLLAGRRVTGVSLQTLDDKAFDHGLVLAQTPANPDSDGALRIPVECVTVPQLQALVTPVAAQMLVDGLKDGLHVPPLEDVGWKPRQGENGNGNGKGNTTLLHAPKITKADRQLTYAALRACDSEPSATDPGQRGALARMHHAIGPLWFVSRNRAGEKKRVFIDDMEEVPGLSPANRPSMLLTREDFVMGMEKPAGSGAEYWRVIVPLCDSPEGEGPDGEKQTQKQDSQGEEEDTSNGKDNGKGKGKDVQNSASARLPGVCLVFWDPPSITAAQKLNNLSNDSATGAENDKIHSGVLYLGNYRVSRLKVEGYDAKPARQVLHGVLDSSIVLPNTGTGKWEDGAVIQPFG
ncbi:Formyltransferase [Nemania sp. FL0916]|nr:Formyltransferase [Nemania sp. FL0916]